MSKIEDHLKEWTSLNFISVDQADIIRQHEAKKPESAWVLRSFLALGVLVISIGVISLIASNWSQIPDWLKISCDFILLISIGALIIKTFETEKFVFFEALLLFFMMLCLASIGLISQIYHTSGEFYQALLLWSLITFPLILASRQILVPLIWASAFFIGFLDWFSLSPIFEADISAVSMLAPLFCLSVTFISSSFEEDSVLTSAFRLWTIFAGLTAIVFAETGLQPAIYTLTPYIPSYFLAGFIVFAVLTNIKYKSLQKCLLLLTLAFFMISFNLSFVGINNYFMHAAITILELAFMSIFWASLNERLLFQGFVFLLGLRFLFIYFQAFGGLANTGFGLVIYGVLIIGLALLWNKYRTKLTDLVERWIR